MRLAQAFGGFEAYPRCSQKTPNIAPRTHRADLRMVAGPGASIRSVWLPETSS